jgi:hypothetical protein
MDTEILESGIQAVLSNLEVFEAHMIGMESGRFS